MIRRAAALVLALTIFPASVHAQDTVVTITVDSADVYRGPSNVTPVVGHVSRGKVLPVTRNLGSWLKVPWPSAPDGVGYVHMTMGRLSTPTGGTPMMTSTSPRAISAGPPQQPMTPRAPAPARTGDVVVRNQQDGTTISHVLGLGAQVGTMSSFGATARAWRSNRVGIQVTLTRDAMTSEVAAGRVTSTQVEPAVVYALLDSVRDYFWVRPYVGSGLSFRHQTFNDPAVVPSASDNGVGYRVFGGSEFTFAGVARFGVSVEAGYRHVPQPFPGFEAAPFSVSIAGHWYIK